MKKILFITLFLATVFFSSCSKDGVPNSGDLSGTTWKFTRLDSEGDEYMLFKFKTKTTLEFWYKPYGSSLEKDGEGVYYIEGSKITIDDGIQPVTGTIDKTTISFVHDGELYKFIKQ